ncbi:hypothetical protein ACFL5Y_04015, partial [Candidatus Omnitrophota bacterium]
MKSDDGEEELKRFEDILTTEGLEGDAYAEAAQALYNIATNNPGLSQQAIQTLESVLNREGLASNAYRQAAGSSLSRITFNRPDLIQPSTVQALESVLTRKGLEDDAYLLAADALSNIAKNRPDLSQQAIQTLESILTRERLESNAYRQAAGSSLSRITFNRPDLIQPSTVQALESVLTRKGLEDDAYEAAVGTLSGITKNRPDLFAEVYSVYKRLIDKGREEEAQLLKEAIMKNLPEEIPLSVIPKIKGEDWPIIIAGIDDKTGFKLSEEELREILFESDRTKQSLLAITIKQKLYRKLRAKEGVELKEYRIPQNNVPSYVGYYKQPWDVFCKFMDENYDAFHKDPSAFNRDIAQQDLGKIDLGDTGPDGTKLYSIDPLSLGAGLGAVSSLFAWVMDLVPAHPFITGLAVSGVVIGTFKLVWRYYENSKVKRLEGILTTEGLASNACEAAEALADIAYFEPNLIQPSTVQALESVFTRKGLESDAYRYAAHALNNIAGKKLNLIQPSTAQTLESFLTREGLENSDIYSAVAIALAGITKNRPDLSQPSTVQALESFLTQEGSGSVANESVAALYAITLKKLYLIQRSTVQALESVFSRNHTPEWLVLSKQWRIDDIFSDAAYALQHIAEDKPDLIQGSTVQALESVLTWEILDCYSYEVTVEAVVGALATIATYKPDLFVFAGVYSFYKHLIKDGRKEQAQLLKKEIIKSFTFPEEGIPPSAIARIKGEDWPIIIGGIDAATGFKLRGKELSGILFEPNGTKQSLLAITIKQKFYRELRAKEGVALKEYRIPEENIPSYVGYYKQPWDVFCEFMDENYDAFHENPSAFNRGLDQIDLSTTALGDTEPDDTKPEPPSMA